MTIALSPQHSTSPLRSSPLAKPPWVPSKNGGGNGSARGSGGNGIRKGKGSYRHDNGSNRDRDYDDDSDNDDNDGIEDNSRREPRSTAEIPIPPRTPVRGIPPSTSTASPSSPTAASPSSPSSPLSRSHPLLGSYHLSLLHARMSAHAPHSVPSFSLRLKAVGMACPPGTPSSVRNPPPLDVQFKATYYDLAEGVNTPWVADVDLEGWFLSSYGERPSGNGTSGSVSGATSASKNGNGNGSESGSPSASTGACVAGLGITGAGFSPPPSPRPTRSLSLSLGTGPSASPSTSAGSPGSTGSHTAQRAAPLAPPPHYPGYRVPPVGQLQILVRTPSAPIKLFVLSFDLRSLPLGGRMYARERTYVTCPVANHGPGGTGNNSNSHSRSPSKGASSPSKDASTVLSRSPSKPGETLRYAVQLQFTCTSAPPEEVAQDPDARAYYVTKTLKLVFASRPPESADPVRTERSDATAGPAECDKLEEWIRVRRRYLAVTRHGTNHHASSPASSPLLKKARLRPHAVRGFSPSPSREQHHSSSPVPPRAMASPRSLLSALDPRGDDDDGSGSGAGTGTGTSTSANGSSTGTSASGSPSAGLFRPTPYRPAPEDTSSLGTAVASALLAPVPRSPPSSLLIATGSGSAHHVEDASAAALAGAAAAIARATSPRPPSIADNNRRRRGSRAERELSERLRAMELRRLGEE